MRGSIIAGTDIASYAVSFLCFSILLLIFQSVKKGHNKHLDLFTNKDNGIILWHSGELFALEMGV